MRTDLVLRSLAFLLLVGLILQVSRRASQRSDETEMVPIEVGKVLTTELVSVKTGGKVVLPEGCWVAFVIHPDCPSCAGLADRWRSRSGLAGAINLFWISVGGLRQTLEFSEVHRLPPEWVFVLDGDLGEPGLGILERIGLGAVPTRLLLSNGSIVSEILMTHKLPGSPQSERLCWPLN